MTNKPSDQTDIRILVKSDIAALKLDSFDQREATMIEEAQQHNQLLRELCKSDHEYDLRLRSIYSRKQQI